MLRYVKQPLFSCDEGRPNCRSPRLRDAVYISISIYISIYIYIIYFYVGNIMANVTSFLRGSIAKTFSSCLKKVYWLYSIDNFDSKPFTSREEHEHFTCIALT